MLIMLYDLRYQDKTGHPVIFAALCIFFVNMHTSSSTWSSHVSGNHFRPLTVSPKLMQLAVPPGLQANTGSMPACHTEWCNTALSAVSIALLQRKRFKKVLFYVISPHCGKYGSG